MTIRDQWGQYDGEWTEFHYNLLAILEEVASPDVNSNLSLTVYMADILDLFAADKSLADLLPEECETCGGSGEVTVHCGSEYCGGCDDPNCVQLDVHPCFDGCGGSGKVWNPEVVERVAQALEPWEPDYGEAMARAVLAALTEEEK